MQILDLIYNDIIVKRYKYSMIRKWRNQREIPTQTEGWEITKMTRTYIKKTYHKPSEQLFPNRQPLSYLNRTKNMKMYITAQKFDSKTQNN